jgi:hypothetical protein
VLTVAQLVKIFPEFYETPRFVTAFTIVHHLYYPETDQSGLCLHPTPLTSISILSYYLCLGLPSGLFASSFLTKTMYAPLLSSPPHVLFHPTVILDLITQIIFG